MHDTGSGLIKQGLPDSRGFIMSFYWSKLCNSFKLFLLDDFFYNFFRLFLLDVFELKVFLFEKTYNVKIQMW